MSIQRDLNGDPLPEHIRGRDHLTMVQPPNPSSLSADADRSECWCLLCANRITVGSGEWGHAQDCHHHQEFDGDEGRATPKTPSATNDQTTLSGIGAASDEEGGDE